jgi:endonuclease/exonuclease/phosphatase family metal-dependent hydrolase
MTYNIHGCRGTDGRLDLNRIAEVMSGFRPNIVALQEVDVYRTRSGTVDQAAQLAARLGLVARFAPTIAIGNEQYGIAILTCLPVLDTYHFCLPWRESDRFSEPRCALVTRLDWHGIQVNMINTHLSVRFDERRNQAAEVVRALESVNGVETMILAGDFNCIPWSRPFRTLCHRLQRAASPKSWPSALPLLPLDHILFHGPLRVTQSGVWRGPGARHASDHVPVIAEFERIAKERAV